MPMWLWTGCSKSYANQNLLFFYLDFHQVNSCCTHPCKHCARYKTGLNKWVVNAYKRILNEWINFAVWGRKNSMGSLYRVLPKGNGGSSVAEMQETVTLFCGKGRRTNTDPSFVSIDKFSAPLFFFPRSFLVCQGCEETTLYSILWWVGGKKRVSNQLQTLDEIFQLKGFHLGQKEITIHDMEPI